MSKAPIILSAQAMHSLERLQPARHSEAAAEKDTSVAEMLSQLHGIAGMLLRELKIDDQPIAKRLSMAKDMAKLIPLLAVAERKVRKSVKDKDVEDMTDAELRQARRALKSVKAR